MGKIVDASHSILGYIIYQVLGFSFCDLYFWERLYPSVQSSSGQAADATIALSASTSSSLWFQHGFFFSIILSTKFLNDPPFQTLISPSPPCCQIPIIDRSIAISHVTYHPTFCSSFTLMVFSCCQE